ncbi:MAG TPA: DUF4258 domain-containing protein [Acidobacteriota bacterium]|nr:DUF4258 domain-containing protein [Acidobacteriota bacterium]
MRHENRKRPRGLEELRRTAKEGSIVHTLHFRKELRDAGADSEDVNSVLHDPDTVLESMQFDQSFSNWKCRIRGPDSRGEPLTIIAALDEENATIVLITAF